MGNRGKTKSSSRASLARWGRTRRTDERQQHRRRLIGRNERQPPEALDLVTVRSTRPTAREVPNLGGSAGSEPRRPRADDLCAAASMGEGGGRERGGCEKSREPSWGSAVQQIQHPDPDEEGASPPPATGAAKAAVARLHASGRTTSLAEPEGPASTILGGHTGFSRRPPAGRDKARGCEWGRRQGSFGHPRVLGGWGYFWRR